MTWTPERRAAHAARMRKQWQDPEYRQAVSAKIAAANSSPENQALNRQKAMKLNERIKTDISVRGAWLAGIHRGWLSDERRAAAGEHFRALAATPEGIERSRANFAHVDTRQKSLKSGQTRRRNLGIAGLTPDEMRDFQRLVHKVGSEEAHRIHREEVARRLRKVHGQ